MARIIRASQATQQTIPAPARHTIQESHEETWPQYITRGVSKIPADIYSMGRSGFGIGDLIQQGLGEPRQNVNPQSMNDYLSNYLQSAKTELQQLIPSEQTARQEVASAYSPIFGKEGARYATESRPGDWPMELLSQTIPSLGMGAVRGGLSGLGKQALKEAGILGGGLAGGELGEKVGGRTGRLIGSVTGAFVGGQPVKTLYPSKHLEKYVKQAENYGAVANNAYTLADSLHENVYGNTSKLEQVMDKVGRNLGKGLKKSDQKNIMNNLQQLEESIQNGKMSLEDAKTFRRNLNEYTYDFKTSNAYKTQVKPLIKELGTFIEESGSPEHTKAWRAGEEATKKKYAALNKIPDTGLDKVIKLGEKALSKSGWLGMGSYLLGVGLGHTTKGLIGSGLAGALHAASEAKYIKRVLQEHPEIAREYKKTLLHQGIKDIGGLSYRLNKLGDKVDKYAKQIEKTEPQSSRRRIVRAKPIPSTFE